MMAATLTGFTGLTLRAETPEAAPLAPQWDAALTVRSGAGYKDNVFLSHLAPQGSAFLAGGAELMAFRLAPEGPQLSLFGSVDAQRFLARGAEHTETVAFSQAQLEQDFTDWCKGSLAAQYFFQDQILDVSVSEINRRAVDATGHRFTGRPGVRFSLPHQLWLAWEPAASRQYYELPLDDYWEASPLFTLGWNWGPKSELSLGYGPSWLWYDTEPARTQAGAVIPDSQRQRFQQEPRLSWRQTWDERRRWRTTAALSTKLNQENGGGYFDYTRWLASGRVEYRAEPWRLSATLRLAHYDYANQSVSALDQARRRRTEVTVGARVERKLYKRLLLIATYEFEQTLSNDAFETYTVNTLSGALEWEF